MNLADVAHSLDEGGRMRAKRNNLISRCGRRVNTWHTRIHGCLNCLNSVEKGEGEGKNCIREAGERLTNETQLESHSEHSASCLHFSLKSIKIN